MKPYDFETWDVFTDKPFAGNQLAVVFDARGLSTDAMQAITREFNFAETTFVLPPADPAHAAHVRIFNPGYEMPFAGHPTVGTAVAIARSRRLTGELVLELKAGLFRVKTDMDRTAPFAQFENPNDPAEQGPAPAAEVIEAALSLAKGAVDRGGHAPRVVGAGVNFVYAKAPLDAVRRAKINGSAWEALALDHTVGVLLYAEGGEAKDATYHVRMFAPDAGVSEDPATGSAACALPGKIALSQKLTDGAHHWVIEQGYELGRPSRIEVEFDSVGGKARRVRVGGAATLIARGQIFV